MSIFISSIRPFPAYAGRLFRPSLTVILRTRRSAPPLRWTASQGLHSLTGDKLMDQLTSGFQKFSRDSVC